MTAHTTGFEALAETLATAEWTDLEAVSGLTRADMASYAAAATSTLGWSGWNASGTRSNTSLGPLVERHGMVLRDRGDIEPVVAHVTGRLEL